MVLYTIHQCGCSKSNRKRLLDLEGNIGINLDFEIINACKKIRGLAKLDRVKLDTSEHRSGLNKHLFEYIEYCGYDVLSYIKRYLSLLQPFMLERKKSQEPDKHFICVIDKLYRISLYIKVYNIQFEEIIVSFHEDNRNGIAKNNSVHTVAPEYVPIIAENVESQVIGENSYSIRVLFMRGLLTLPMSLSAKRVDKLFMVRYSAIEQGFLSYCNDYLRDLYTSDLDLDFESIDIFTALQQIEFTSYGKDSFLSVSLLLDSFDLQRDQISRKVADFALVTYVSNLKLIGSDRDEFLHLLKTKYSASSSKNIITRIDDLLPSLPEESVVVDEEKVWLSIPEATRYMYGSTKEEIIRNYVNKHKEDI